MYCVRGSIAALGPVSFPASQAEAVEPFVGPNVIEHRLHHRHPMTIELSALLAVDALLHQVSVGGPALQLQVIGDLPLRDPAQH